MRRSKTLKEFLDWVRSKMPNSPIVPCDEDFPEKQNPTIQFDSFEFDDAGILTADFTATSNNTPPGTLTTQFEVYVDGVSQGTFASNSPFVFNAGDFEGDEIQVDATAFETLNGETCDGTASASGSWTGGGGEPAKDEAAFVLQPLAFDVPMCEPTDFDLSSMVVSAPAGSSTRIMQYLRTGSNNVGDWQPEGNFGLCYTSEIGTGTIEATVTVRCTDDATGEFVEKTETLTFTLTETYTLESIKPGLLADLQSAWNGHINGSNPETRIAFAEHTIRSTKDLLCATCDTDYWDNYVDNFETLIAQATERFTTDGPTSPGCTGVIGSPSSVLGATLAEYHAWPDCPPTKALRNLAAAVMELTLEVLCNNPCNLSEAQLTKAVELYDWVHFNIVERLFTRGINVPGGGGNDLQSGAAYLALSAITQIPGVNGRDPNHAEGYWSSQTQLAMYVAMLDDKLRQKLNRPQYPYQLQEVQINDPMNAANWSGGGILQGTYTQGTNDTVRNYDYERLFSWWVASTELTGGALQWDSGVAEFNFPGEIREADPDHTRRLVCMVHAMDEHCPGGTYLQPKVGPFETVTTTDLLAQLATTFEDLICLDDTPNAVEIANYINGSTSPFRGGDFPFTFGWSKLAETSKQTLRCIARIWRWVRTANSGNRTFEVHNTTIGRPQIAGAKLSAIARRNGKETNTVPIVAQRPFEFAEVANTKGNPITRISHVDGLPIKLSGIPSGDTQGINADDLAITVDGDSGYAVDWKTQQNVRTFALQDSAAGLPTINNDRFSWGVNAREVVYLRFDDAANPTTVEVVSKQTTGEENWTLALPSNVGTVPSGEADADIDGWVLGRCSGDDIQFALGSKGPHVYVQPFDATTGTLMAGTWIEDINFPAPATGSTRGQNYRCFPGDGTAGTAGLYIEPLNDPSRQYFVEWAWASPAVLMETSTNNRTHQSAAPGNAVLYGDNTGGGADLVGIEIQDPSDGSATNYCSFSQAEVNAAANWTDGTTFSGFNHGNLIQDGSGYAAAFFITNQAGTDSRVMAIEDDGAGNCSLVCVAEFTPSPGPIQTSRTPTIGFDASGTKHVAWKDGTNVYVVQL